MLFIDNKYTTWYNSIINQAKQRIISGYVEKHHIIPKSFGGSNKKENLVALTAREHYICHLLLTKMVNGKYRAKMLYALSLMKPKVKHNFKLYESLKIEGNKARSIALKGKTHTPDARKKIKAKRALQIITDETKLKMSASHKGKKHSPEHIEKTRQSHLGSKRSEETKKRLSDSRKYYPRIKCIHCGLEAVTVNHNRWHGDFCLSNPNKLSRPIIGVKNFHVPSNDGL